MVWVNKMGCRRWTGVECKGSVGFVLRSFFSCFVDGHFPRCLFLIAVFKMFISYKIYCFQCAPI
jgi:hypothetical protein